MSYLKDAKVGDVVAVGYGWRGWNAHFDRRIVAKVTATQVTLDDGQRFTKRGRRVGEPMSRLFAKPWDEEEQADIAEDRRKRELRHEVRRAFDNASGCLTTEQCEQIIAICEEAAK